MTDQQDSARDPIAMRVSSRLTVEALPPLPSIEPGDDLAALVGDAIAEAASPPLDCDVIVLASKVVSKAENCYVDLARIEVSAKAVELAEEVGKEPELVELILRESSAISRSAPGVLIVRHRLGLISANAAVDRSNARPANASPGSGRWVLTLPADPDASAGALRERLEQRFGLRFGLLITDSLGRPFRLGTLGAAIGVSGFPPIWEHAGRRDRDGRPLEHTRTALADQLATAADLVAGQADEGRALTRVRGLGFPSTQGGVSALLRSPEQDLYA